MRKLIVFLALISVFSLGVTAQEKGWVIGLEYEKSNHDGNSENRLLYSNAFKLSGGYRIPLPVTRLFVLPKVNFNYRKGGNNFHGDGLLVSHCFRSLGCGFNAFLGFRVFRFLEVFTGPGADWYFYNHETVKRLAPYDDLPLRPWLEDKDGATYSYWTFGVGVPVGRFTIEGSYRQHMNSPNAEIQLNRWTVGATFRF